MHGDIKTHLFHFLFFLFAEFLLFLSDLTHDEVLALSVALSTSDVLLQQILPNLLQFAQQAFMDALNGSPQAVQIMRDTLQSMHTITQKIIPMQNKSEGTLIKFTF